nr:MAG TPA: hypothetical protein [Caudoviricetes sp.]
MILLTTFTFHIVNLKRITIRITTTIKRLIYIPYS